MKLPRLVSSALSAIASVALLTSAHAGNLLLNPSFELNTGNTIPLNWTFFLPPPVPNPHDYWIVNSSVDACSPHFPAEDGTYVWKEWSVTSSTNTVPAFTRLSVPAQEPSIRPAVGSRPKAVTRLAP